MVRPRHPKLLAFWTALWLAGALCLALVVVQHRREQAAGAALRAAQAQRERDRVTAERHRHEAIPRLRALWDQSRSGNPGDWTRPTLEARLSGGKPFAASPGDGRLKPDGTVRRAAIYVDPAGVPFELAFGTDGVWSGWDVFDPSAPMSPTGPPRPMLPPSQIDAFDAVRARVMRAAGWAWLGMLGLAVVLSTTRRGVWLARGSFAAAVIFLVMAVAQRPYARMLPAADVALYVAPVLMLLSGIFIAIGRANERLMREDTRRRGICPVCGYDLRYSPGRCPECGTPAPDGVPAAPPTAPPSAPPAAASGITPDKVASPAPQTYTPGDSGSSSGGGNAGQSAGG